MQIEIVVFHLLLRVARAAAPGYTATTLNPIKLRILFHKIVSISVILQILVEKLL